MCRWHKLAGFWLAAFCIGVISALILPIFMVAVVEAFIIVFLGYCCLFKW